jgi:ABC-type nitrate/sulfonate/bicarbonate transport system substrate-binding protein
VYARNCVYKHVTGWEAFEPALTRAEEIDIDQIWRIAAEIPPEWYEFDTAGLNRLVEGLYSRRSAIRALITAFRHSTRTPFPNWTSA